MRILVISDSHRNQRVVDKIIQGQPSAEHVFFLGDNTDDIEDFIYMYPEKSFHIVSGNCDFSSHFKSTDTITIDNKKILFTHGHTLGVKYSLQGIITKAKEENSHIALYGHTHISRTLYEDGLWIVNPGSCSRPRDSCPSYAVVDVTPKGIMPIIINI